MKYSCFGDATQTTYIGGHGRLNLSWEPKVACYSPQKCVENTKMVIFCDAPQTMNRWSRSLEIIRGSKKKKCAIAHENGKKT
jgi:hypothetical protein